ncbi:hypothetical protein GOODEAATRI_024508, partial [Goodea atripinnis]
GENSSELSTENKKTHLRKGLSPCLTHMKTKVPQERRGFSATHKSWLLPGRRCSPG